MRNLFAISCLFLVVLYLTSCSKPPQQQMAMPAPEVSVVTLTTSSVQLTTELPGRTTAYRIAEVRPQVSGIILKRTFTEGAEIKEGQQLYQIDPATYKATYESAKATLARAEAVLSSAKLLEQRYKPLVDIKAVSKQEYDNAVASKLQAEADVASAKAAIETAKINLDYTKVESPISGRIGRSTVTEGALVTAQQSVALATVQQLDPIYVDVSQSSSELLRLRRELEQGQWKGESIGETKTKLILEDGSEYEEEGKLAFSEVTVDSSTGSVTLRAVFPNPKRKLLPGMFVRARLNEAVNEQAILVPQRCVIRNQRGEPTAWVVTPDNKADLRALKADRAIGDKWLVTEGLKAGEKVIVEGVQRVAPGAPVRAVEFSGTAQQTNSKE